jgi:VIT1/CCC1 family predicted Fe2+/Mn2+ transporter
VLHASQTALIVCLVTSGAFLGITNTLMTQRNQRTRTRLDRTERADYAGLT